MRKPYILKPTLRGMAAGSLLGFGLSLSAQAQTAPAAAPAEPAAKETTAEAAEAAFRRADANSDGRLSRQEAAALPAVAEKFAEIDRDKDGAISMAEYMAAVAPPRK